MKHARAAAQLTFATIFTREQLEPLRLRSDDHRQPTALDKEIILAGGVYSHRVNYQYRSHTESQLRKIAQVILKRHPGRRLGDFAVDIEGIQEDLGLEILYRPSFGPLPVAGYVARDPRYIVLNEAQLLYMRRARFTIAEEVCHRILEWQLWKSSEIPEGAHAHELTNEQYDRIEVDARRLAAEILERWGLQAICCTGIVN